MNKEKSCLFTGHRIIKNEHLNLVKKFLITKVEELINQGIDTFYYGGAIGFDLLAAKVVLYHKKNYPHIKLILAKPCENQCAKWNYAQIKVYNEVAEQADEIVLISKDYTPNCMQKRNHYMVDNSKYCIAYLTNPRSGTGSTVKYAKEMGLNMFVFDELNN